MALRFRSWGRFLTLKRMRVFFKTQNLPPPPTLTKSPHKRRSKRFSSFAAFAVCSQIWFLQICYFVKTEFESNLKFAKSNLVLTNSQNSKPQTATQTATQNPNRETRRHLSLFARCFEFRRLALSKLSYK